MTDDMSPVIVPKSDQLSADDFISGPATYTIEAVEIRPGTEQPVSIFLAGEKRAWKPCKSMARVLVFAWGPDAKSYRGRSVTLFRDPTVKWGGVDVGGIRISHMSDIKADLNISLTATKGRRAPFKVRRLSSPTQEPKGFDVREWATKLRSELPTFDEADALNAAYDAHKDELSDAARKFMDDAVTDRLAELGGAQQEDELPQ